MISKNLSKIVMKEDGNIFDEMNTLISVDDEAGGTFLKISQHANEHQELRFDFNEWGMIDKTVREIIKEWKDEESDR